MADEGKRNLVTKDMTTFKIRMYTDIPPNAVLVGHNIFTKKPKIYKAAFLHMPWFRSKFVTLENHNRDFAPKKFELGGVDDGLELTSDVAVTYRVKPIDTNMKMGFRERWMSVFSNFARGKVSSYVKAGLLAAGTIAAGVFIAPWAIPIIPVVTAGYISGFHQDESWVKEQGAYKAAYQSKAAMAELEQTIYDELRAFYATHSYEEVKGMKIDFSKPEFADLKIKLDEFSEQYGIEATKITVKTADLTAESNQILQRQKESEMRATEIRRQAEAQQAVHERNLEYVQQLSVQGLSPEQIAQILQVETARGLGSNAIINVGGGAPVQPIITMPMGNNGANQGQTQEPDEDQNSQGGRTR